MSSGTATTSPSPSSSPQRPADGADSGGAIRGLVAAGVAVVVLAGATPFVIASVPTLGWPIAVGVLTLAWLVAIARYRPGTAAAPRSLPAAIGWVLGMILLSPVFALTWIVVLIETPRRSDGSAVADGSAVTDDVSGVRLSQAQSVSTSIAVWTSSLFCLLTAYGLLVGLPVAQQIATQVGIADAERDIAAIVAGEQPPLRYLAAVPGSADGDHARRARLIEFDEDHALPVEPYTNSLIFDLRLRYATSYNAMIGAYLDSHPRPAYLPAPVVFEAAEVVRRAEQWMAEERVWPAGEDAPIRVEPFDDTRVWDRVTVEPIPQGRRTLTPDRPISFVTEVLLLAPLDEYRFLLVHNPEEQSETVRWYDVIDVRSPGRIVWRHKSGTTLSESDGPSGEPAGE